ncbi:small ribosomal subunit protein bS6m-like [Babylonia areolata]|uniref:small ribosomal subunit protein bS6m-like n=1 Tax=Babylonia areolata TaxID=304850 RepID=UPI003FCFFBE4
MPSYELSLIVKTLQRPELARALRRSCATILEKGGIIRSMENLGHKTLPYKMSAHGQRHMTGSYFLVHFDSPTSVLPEVKDEFKRDVDIVRHNVSSTEDSFVRPCLTGPCQFGELPNPDHERRVWKRRTLKKLNLTNRDKQRLL